MKATRLAAILLAASLFSGSACQYVDLPFGPRPEVESRPYAGPRIDIDSWGMRHTLTFTAPSGGWSFDVDQVRDLGPRREVFITARRPDPSLMVTMALHRLHADSEVDSRIPIDVYARVVDHAADPAPFPYRLVAQTDR